MRIVVVGGGVAGCAAAVAAAESGAQVCLVEAANHLGGVAARGEHRTLCGLAPIDASGPELLEPALTAAWVEDLADGEAWRQGRVWLWPTSAERLMTGLMRRLVAAGVEVRRGQRVDAVETTAGRIAAVMVGGETRACEALIDACGGPALARLLGGAVRPHRAWGSWRGVLSASIPEGPSARVRCLTAIAQATGLLAGVALVPLADQRWQLSLDCPPGCTPADAEAMAAKGAAAVGGTVLASTVVLAQRDEGGWQGTVDADRLFACRARGLCWAAWPVEAHGPQGVAWSWPLADRHGIPPACIRPEGSPDNLVVIGKGMPVGDDAIAALRVTGTQLALGASVGSALAVDGLAGNHRR